MLKSKNIDFRFHTDLDIIKGNEKEGEEKVMRMGGIASTEVKDSDDEILKIDGMDLSNFTHSFVNWNHQSNKSPELIIGQVDKAEKRDGELYVEVSLFPENSTAQNVYKLAQILEKKKEGRKLGFSIEGRAIERDSLNEKIVKRSVLSGIAICASPKNPSTLAQIIKGETDGLGEPQYDIDERANGGDQKFVLDLTDEYGNKITVSKDFEIKIEKVSKALDTSSGAALIPESVKGGVKELENSKKLKKSFENTDKDIIFKAKSDVYDYLFKSVSDLDVNTAKNVYSFVKSYQENKKETMADLTADKISKALDFLNVIADKADGLEKAEGSKVGEGKKTMGGSEDVIEKMAGKMKPMIAKGMKKEDIYKSMKEDEDEEVEDEDMEKAYKKAFDMTDKKEDKKDDKKEDKDDMKKSFETELEKAEARVAELKAEIEKSNTDKPLENKEGENVADLIKSMREEFGKKFQALGEINKAILDDNAELRDSLKKAENDFEELANASSGRKSVTTQSYIEKGQEPNAMTKSNDTVLSVSQHKQDIIKKGEELWMNGESENDIKLLKAVDNFAYGQPLANDLVKAFSERGIKLVK